MISLSIGSKWSCVDGVVVFSPKLERQISLRIRVDVGAQITACITGVASGSPMSMEAQLSVGSQWYPRARALML